MVMFIDLNDGQWQPGRPDRDGERFLVAALLPINPDDNAASVVVVRFATNHDVVLARVANEWVRYDLP